MHVLALDHIYITHHSQLARLLLTQDERPWISHHVVARTYGGGKCLSSEVTVIVEVLQKRIFD